MTHAPVPSAGPRKQILIRDDRRAEAFMTTNWSMVLCAGDSQSPGAASAMERLCRNYWYPLYSFVRRKGHGHEDACDLTQGFFARFLEKSDVRSADVNRGKFRTFLLASMTHFLLNEWDKSKAQRRGGACHMISLDHPWADARYQLETVDQTTPETLFDRRWAHALMAVVIDRLTEESTESRFEILKEFLPGGSGAVSYEAAAARLGMSVAGVTSAIHRMRARFRALLYEEVANTVGSPEEIEPELRHLLAALGK